jgi:hypothetical protein
MADEEPRAGELTTANYGWTKPTVGASADAWGGYINTDLDGIDSTVHAIQVSIPVVTTTTPAMDGTATIGSTGKWADGGHIHPTDTSRAPLASPALTGNPTAPTPTAGDNDTSIATTAFVTAAVAAGAGVTTFNTRAGAVTLSNADVVAVHQVASTTPIMDGTATIGATGKWADAGHVHPTDTSRAAASALANYQPLAGVTDGSNAPAGQVGEVLSTLVTTGVSLTSGAQTNIGTLTLSAGDWDVFAEVWYSYQSGGATQTLQSGINTVSATLPSPVALNTSRTTFQVVWTNTSQIQPISPARASVTVSTIYYLIAYASFTTGPVTATGKIWARRAR